MNAWKDAHHRICPGKELADAILFIFAAQTLAVFTIEKARDADGKEIEPTEDYTNGVIRWELQSLWILAFDVRVSVVRRTSCAPSSLVQTKQSLWSKPSKTNTRSSPVILRSYSILIGKEYRYSALHMYVSDISFQRPLLAKAWPSAYAYDFKFKITLLFISESLDLRQTLTWAQCLTGKWWCVCSRSCTTTPVTIDFLHPSSSWWKLRCQWITAFSERLGMETSWALFSIAASR